MSPESPEDLVRPGMKVEADIIQPDGRVVLGLLLLRTDTGWDAYVDSAPESGLTRAWSSLAAGTRVLRVRAIPNMTWTPAGSVFVRTDQEQVVEVRLVRVGPDLAVVEHDGAEKQLSVWELHATADHAATSWCRTQL